MEIVFDKVAKNDIIFWKKSGNIAIQKRIQKLLKAIEETPFTGMGKPEALKHSLRGKWSRRINDEHRIIYSIKGNNIRIHSLKGHYGN